jgi:elongation factor G
MKGYKPENIRNIALLGHQGSGKTSFLESALSVLGVSNRKGRVEEGNTVSDFTKEEQSHGFSLSTSIVPIEWNDHKYNFLDTPGLFDFVGEVNSALRVTRGAVIVVDATSGVEVGTEKDWEYVRNRSIPTILFINKMDKENINFDKLLTEIREKLGNRAVPFCIPIGREKDFEGFVNVVDMKARIYKDGKGEDAEIWDEKRAKVDELHEMILESVAEVNEENMEKFFAGEEFTIEEIHDGLKEAIQNGELVPIMVGSAEKNVGVRTLLDMVWDYFPSPTTQRQPFGEAVGELEVIEREMSEDAPFSAVVFKTVVDPFIGRMSYVKVRSGKVKKDDVVFNPNKDEKERISFITYLRGKEQLEAKELTAGDIGVITKLSYTETGDTLCDMNNGIKYREIRFPQPTHFVAIDPKKKSDDDKLMDVIHKILLEDKTLSVTRNRETHQLLLGGQGQYHIDMTLEKIFNMYAVELVTSPAKIVYRETIRGKADVQGKYKKQSGGSGQYGDVKIKFEPTEEEFEFEEKIFGGSVPKRYIPAVEKGLIESCQKGVLAGFPVIGLKATLYDGSYHDVDSSELAFKMAASIAFKEGCKDARPTLLEPIMHVEVTVPENYVGDVMGDLNKRRGMVLGLDPDPKRTVIKAEVPQVDMLSYTIDLKSMTQARGKFTMDFERYEDVPEHLASKVIEATKSEH